MSFAKRFKFTAVALIPFICLAIVCATTTFSAEFIHKKYVVINKTRETLSKAYILEHYGIAVDTPEIIPKIIVVHWTALDSFEGSYNVFKKPYLSSNRTGKGLGVKSLFLTMQNTHNPINHHSK